MEGKSDEEQEEEEEREVVVVVRGKHSLEDKGPVILSLLSLSLSHSLTSQQRGTLNFLSFLLGLSPKNKKVFLSSFLSNPFSREEKKRRESTHTQNTQGERE